MKILTLFFKSRRGGLNFRLYKLIRAFLRANHSMCFIGTEKIPFENSKLSQIVMKIPFNKQENMIFWVLFIFVAIFKSFWMSRELKIKKIITFGPFYSLLCILPVCILKIPAITFVRADNMRHSQNALRNLFFYFVEWAGINISKNVLFVSHNLKSVYQKRYSIREEKTVIIQNNIEKNHPLSFDEKQEIRRTLEIGPDVFLISTMGVFNRGKNFTFLIRAMKQLGFHDVKLLIIGDEISPRGEKKHLEKLVEYLHLQDKVIFLGWQESPSSFIASSDLFVFPSKHEGSPNALLEALGSGIPCFASRIDELVEVLKYEELLFRLDNFGELVEKIARAKTDPAFYAKVKSFSNKRCQHFIFDWGRRVSDACLQ